MKRPAAAMKAASSGAPQPAAVTNALPSGESQPAELSAGAAQVLAAVRKWRDKKGEPPQLRKNPQSEEHKKERNLRKKAQEFQAELKANGHWGEVAGAESGMSSKEFICLHRLADRLVKHPFDTSDEEAPHAEASEPPGSTAGVRSTKQNVLREVEAFVLQVGIFPRESLTVEKDEESLAMRLRQSRKDFTPDEEAVLEKLHGRTTVGRLDWLKRGMECCPIKEWGYLEDLGQDSEKLDYLDEQLLWQIPVDKMMRDWASKRPGQCDIPEWPSGERYSNDSWAYVFMNIDLDQQGAVSDSWELLSRRDIHRCVRLVIGILEDIVESAPRPDHTAVSDLRCMIGMLEDYRKSLVENIRKTAVNLHWHWYEAEKT